MDLFASRRPTTHDSGCAGPIQGPTSRFEIPLGRWAQNPYHG